MSSEISDWISLVAAITAFMAYLEAQKVTRNSKAIETLRIVVDAADKTETYCTLRAEGAERNRARENELAELWSHASTMVRRIDRNLAFRLHDKSRFWRNPETWDADEIRRAGISLSSVRMDANRLLDNAA